jgi:PPM family protein phosphatase
VIDYGGHTQPGPRPYNEDAYTIKDLSAWAPRLNGVLVFAAVSDGMGGHEAGDVASSEAILAAEHYIDALLQLADAGPLAFDPATVLVEIGRAANAAVLSAGAERGIQSMGATLVAMFATEDVAWIGHVGDSRAYRLTREGATQLTADHSAVGRMIAEGVLTEEQAQTHPQRNVIERALGFDDDRPVEIDSVGLGPRDVVLLCSDGVSTVLTGPDLREIVFGSKSLAKAASSVVAEALAAGGDDNATVVAWSADFASRGAGTLPGGRAAKRGMSPQRRQAKRHGRAQRASWVFVGLLVLAALALFAFGGNLFGGGASGGTVAPVSKPASSTAGVTRAEPATSGIDANGTKAPRIGTHGHVTSAVNLRSEKVVDPSTLIGKLREGVQVVCDSGATVVSPDTWVHVTVLDGRYKDKVGWVVVGYITWDGSSK